VHSDVAILHSYDSRWAINWQRHNKAFDPVANMVTYYGALRAQTHSVDIVNPAVSLQGYKLVVAPALNVITPEIAKNLIDYVQHGGHLVLGQRSAMKNEDNGLQTERQPGPFAALLGGRVEQFYALDKPAPVEGTWGPEQTNIWAEQLSVSSPETKVLMRYGKSNGWLDGQPAAITRDVGKGSITYIGAALEGETLNSAVRWMLNKSEVHPEFGALPDGVDLYIRKDAEHEAWILINFGEKPQQVALPGTFTDVLKGGSTHAISLNQYDVTVLERKASAGH
jgi:beta-galactosidase